MGIPGDILMNTIFERYMLANVYIWHMIISLLLVIIYAITNVIAKKIILSIVRKLVIKSKFSWDDQFYKNKVFHYFTNIIPAFVIYISINLIPNVHESFGITIQRIAISIMVFSGMMAFNALLTSLNDIYGLHPKFKERPIKGYIQLIKLIVFIVCFVIIISILLDRSPWLFISSLGALTAVILLVFKDTLLSVVASIQLTSNNMIHVGDWIEMPKYNADGDVIDIALHTVQIQNFDKTITSIPTQKFIEESFKNWRGMSQYGSRRIKRSIFIDLASIRFLNDQDLAQYERFYLLKDYITEKRKSIITSNDTSGKDTLVHNSRKLTNIGTFRNYVRLYLKQHPLVSPDATLLIRQLQPTTSGLPIEIYIFIKEVRWTEYENTQSDIFDHILSIVPEFDLRLFQNPTGNDFKSIT